MSKEESRVLIDLKKGSPIIEFGAHPDVNGRIPAWAQFRVVEMDPRHANDLTFTPGPKDWAVVVLRPNLSIDDKISHFGRVALTLTRLGFRKIFVDQIWDSFMTPAENRDEFPPPDPYLLGWIGVGRFLAQSEFVREFQWDPAGTFLLFEKPSNKGTSGTLVAFSNSEEPLAFKLWTGDRLRGKDLLETERRIKFDPETARSEFEVGPVPVFVEPFPSGRVETAMSVRRVSRDLRPYPLTQRLTYEVENRMDRRVEMELELEPPEGWVVRDRVTSSSSLLPGQKRLWAWDVDLPQPTPLLRRLVFRVRVRMNDSANYDYIYEDRVPLGSDVVELEIEPHGRAAHSVHFRLRSVRDEPVRLSVFARLFGDSPIALNLDRLTLPPRGTRAHGCAPWSPARGDGGRRHLDRFPGRRARRLQHLRIQSRRGGR